MQVMGRGAVEFGGQTRARTSPSVIVNSAGYSSTLARHRCSPGCLITSMMRSGIKLCHVTVGTTA